MQYLGRIAGSGQLMREGEPIARASYEFEGFMRPRGIVVGSGEIRLSPVDLKAVFGRPRIQLRTDDGRMLDLRFSEKELRLANGIAEVEVTGQLPGSLSDWRGGSTATLAYAAPAESVEPAPVRSPAPALNARRRASA